VHGAGATSSIVDSSSSSSDRLRAAELAERLREVEQRIHADRRFMLSPSETVNSLDGSDWGSTVHAGSAPGHGDHRGSVSEAGSCSFALSDTSFGGRRAPPPTACSEFELSQFASRALASSEWEESHSASREGAPGREDSEELQASLIRLANLSRFFDSTAAHPISAVSDAAEAENQVRDLMRELAAVRHEKNAMCERLTRQKEMAETQLAATLAVVGHQLPSPLPSVSAGTPADSPDKAGTRTSSEDGRELAEVGGEEEGGVLQRSPQLQVLAQCTPSAAHLAPRSPAMRQVPATPSRIHVPSAPLSTVDDGREEGLGQESEQLEGERRKGWQETQDADTAEGRHDAAEVLSPGCPRKHNGQEEEAATSGGRGAGADARGEGGGAVPASGGAGAGLADAGGDGGKNEDGGNSGWGGGGGEGIAGAARAVAPTTSPASGR